jgi:predicted chitinase
VGVDLEFEPDRALEPILSANLFALFALDKHIAQLADAKDWLTIRKRWNGVNRRTGLPNGWEEFKLYVHRLLALVSP